MSPQGEPSPLVESPTGKPSPPVMSPQGEPSPLVESPTGKPSPPMVSPAGKPLSPVASPAGKPSPPVASPAGKPSPPVVSPAGKPSPPVVSPSTKLLEPKISPSVKASPPVGSTAAKSPVVSPPIQPSLSLVSTATKSPTMVSSTSTKSPAPVVSPVTKSQSMVKSCNEAQDSKSPPTLVKHSSKSFSPGNEPKKRSSKSRNESSKTSPQKSKSPFLELESQSSALPPATPQHSVKSEEPCSPFKHSTTISPPITEPQFPPKKHQTKSSASSTAAPSSSKSSSKVKHSKSKRAEVISEAKESQFHIEARLDLESPSSEVSESGGNRSIPVAVVNPVAAVASPLPSIASITATTLSSPMESSPLAGSRVDDSSICTPPSINFVRDNKHTLATVVTNISRISNSKETSLDTKQPDVQNISPLLSIDAMSPELTNKKESIDILNTDESRNILSKCIESSPVSNLKTTESKTMVSKQQEKDENYVGSNMTVKIPIADEKLIASPEIQLPALEASASEISGKQSHTFSVVVNPNAEPESRVIVENPEKGHDVDLVARLSEKDTKESSLSPGMDSLERSSSNTPLQDEKVFSQSDVSMSQTPVSPSALSPRKKNIDKDEETDLEKELEKLKVLKEKIHPPPPKILPPKAVNRRKTSRDEPKMAPKKPLLTE